MEQKNWKEVAGTVNDPHLKRHPTTAPLMGSWRSFLGPRRSGEMVRKFITRLTCDDVGVSVLVAIFWVLRVLSRVLLQAVVCSQLFVLLAEADILKRRLE